MPIVPVETSLSSSPHYTLIENYIYIYQLGVYCILPTYPEQIQDSLGSTFSSENILSRTAPVYSYSYSGPRSMTISLSLHRDLMTAVNYDNERFIDDLNTMLQNDYIDTLVRYLQAMALPKYSAISTSDTYNKMVNPPLVAVRFGNSVFIKGIVDGDVQVTYSGPIDVSGKYQQVDVSFTIKETEPQDAEQLAKNGSFRGLNNLLSGGLYSNRGNSV